MNEVYASGDRIEAKNAKGEWRPAIARSNVYRGKDILLVDVEFPPLRGILPWPADAVRLIHDGGQAPQDEPEPSFISFNPEDD